MAVKLNENKEVVKTVQDGLKRTGGYCPFSLILSRFFVAFGNSLIPLVVVLLVGKEGAEWQKKQPSAAPRPCVSSPLKPPKNPRRSNFVLPPTPESVPPRRIGEWRWWWIGCRPRHSGSPDRFCRGASCPARSAASRRKSGGCGRPPGRE